MVVTSKVGQNRLTIGSNSGGLITASMTWTIPFLTLMLFTIRLAPPSDTEPLTCKTHSSASKVKIWVLTLVPNVTEYLVFSAVRSDCSAAISTMEAYRMLVSTANSSAVHHILTSPITKWLRTIVIRSSVPYIHQQQWEYRQLCVCEHTWGLIR